MKAFIALLRSGLLMPILQVINLFTAADKQALAEVKDDVVVIVKDLKEMFIDSLAFKIPLKERADKLRELLGLIKKSGGLDVLYEMYTEADKAGVLEHEGLRKVFDELEELDEGVVSSDTSTDTV